MHDVGSHQVKAEEERAESRDGQDVDEVAGQAAEPRARVHGGVLRW
jgi:hypothetical protein